MCGDSISQIQKRRVLMKTARQKKVKYLQVFLLISLIPLGAFALADPNPPPSTAKTPSSSLMKEIQRLKVLKEAIPAEKQIAALKFVRRVYRIFSSMRSYLGGGRGILRKDIDRYDDAVVEATGEVPEELIAYVEEMYRELKNNDDRYSYSAFSAKNIALMLWDRLEHLNPP